jgi:hypothetical protein
MWVVDVVRDSPVFLVGDMVGRSGVEVVRYRSTGGDELVENARRDGPLWAIREYEILRFDFLTVREREMMGLCS